MGKIINRTIECLKEEVNDHINKDYFFHGEYPRAEILLDDISQCIYQKIATNIFGEDMYEKIPMRISHYEK